MTDSPRRSTRPSGSELTPRGPLQGLAELTELFGGESPGSRRFLRAALLGAIVGATIAGSSIWRRQKHR